MTDDDGAVSFGRAIAGSDIDDERGWRVAFTGPCLRPWGVWRNGSDVHVAYGFGRLIVYRVGRPRLVAYLPFRLRVERLHRDPFLMLQRRANLGADGYMGARLGDWMLRVGSRIVYREPRS